MRDLLTRIAAWVVERPAPVVALAILLSLVGAVGALSLEADRNPDSLVDSGSDTFAATEEFYEEFGDEPVQILIEGDLQRLMLSKDLGTILALEGCLAGSDQEGTKGEVFGEGEPTPAACTRLAEERPADVVFGPATFLNQTAITAESLLRDQTQAAEEQAAAAAREAADAAKDAGASEDEQLQAAEAAYQEVLTNFQNQLLQAATRYGLSGIPRIDDPTYVSAVVFDQAKPAGTPKARFSYFFPSSDSALVTINLPPGLTQTERERALGLFRDAVEDPAFKLRNGEYVVSGVPVIFDGLADKVSTEIFLLLAVALAVMAIVLAFVFRPPLRLLPLAIALGAAGVVFGLLALVGGSLTMASIAVLPVLTGLAVDYAIQFQARFREALEGGSSPPRAAVEAAAKGGPVIATALVATAAGFLVLLLSPIPMIRGFGLLLVAGVAVAFLFALTAGLATLSMIPKPGGGNGRKPSRAGELLSSTQKRLAVIGDVLKGWGRTALAASISAPARVLTAALILAVVGWIAGTRTEIVSDLRQLLPEDLPELQDVDRLEEATGVSGYVSVKVDADDLTDPQLIAWMAGYEQRVLERHGYESGASSCQDDEVELCPGPTLSTLFAGQDLPTRNQIRDLLDLLPEYFSQAIVQREPSGDGGTVRVVFGIRVMPFDDQKELIDDIRNQLNPPGAERDPPDGVSVDVVGLPALAADANAELGSNRYLLTGAGLLAIALVLLAAYRSLERALVPLIPIVLSTGWSSLVLEAAGVPLNPMSATLGALVVAIATEFSVILAARYHEERDAGTSLGEALRRTYARTGTAVAASGATAIAGFAVLIASGIPMLRDFGLVTVFDLAVALIGVMLVLPAALVWAEGGVPSLRARLRRSGPAPESA